MKRDDLSDARTSFTASAFLNGVICGLSNDLPYVAIPLGANVVELAVIPLTTLETSNVIEADAVR